MFDRFGEYLDYTFNAMRKIFFITASLLMLTLNALADKGGKKKSKESVDSFTVALLKEVAFRDSVVKAMNYKTGVITLNGDFAQLNVPKGFKFLNKEQAEFIITKAWGNPPQSGILGMILPENTDPYSDSTYAFVVSFDDMGFVKDEDAAEQDYDKLLTDIQKEEAENNLQRRAAGYPEMHIIGWAQKPFYDKQKHVLHWAKQIKFGDNEWNTLNYDVRILGRKGVLSLNAVASIRELDMVKRDIDNVLGMASFTDGNRYADYNSSTDKLAVYTIGGLVAGKVLAKAGFFALLLKFGKFIIIGIVAAFAAVKRFLFGNKKQEESYSYTAPPENNNDDTAA